jgi:NDP-sugar pyrophosphorylase family protein
MHDYDPSVPKTLLPVAGRPFADWQLRWLASEGVDNVVYSIGHLGALIRDYVGDGRQWGTKVRYVEETDGLLGTGGAVRLAVEKGVLEDRFFVLYGDSYLRIDLHSVDAAYRSSGKPALMTVFANDGRWDTSNVAFDGWLVTDYRKGLTDPPPQMRYIDYGLLMLDRGTVEAQIPTPRRTDLADLLGALSRNSLLVGYEAAERFFEIGSPSGIGELDEFLKRSNR